MAYCENILFIYNVVLGKSVKFYFLGVSWGINIFNTGDLGQNVVQSLYSKMLTASAVLMFSIHISVSNFVIWYLVETIYLKSKTFQGHEFWFVTLKRFAFWVNNNTQQNSICTVLHRFHWDQFWNSTSIVWEVKPCRLSTYVDFSAFSLLCCLFKIWIISL